MIFNVGLRKAEEVVEEELVGSLEDSMNCPLNLPWEDHPLCSPLPVVAGPHRRDFTVPPGVSPQSQGPYGRVSCTHRVIAFTPLALTIGVAQIHSEQHGTSHKYKATVTL